MKGPQGGTLDDTDGGVLVLRPSRLGNAALLVLAAAFAGVCVWLAAAQADPIAWFGAALFGAAVPVFGHKVFTDREYLRLDRDGFTVAAWPRAAGYAVRRRDVDSFGALPAKRLRGEGVGFVYAPHVRRSAIHGVAKALTEETRADGRSTAGYEAMLPDVYGTHPRELAGLMNRYREKYGGTTGPEPVDGGEP